MKKTTFYISLFLLLFTLEGCSTTANTSEIIYEMDHPVDIQYISAISSRWMRSTL